MADDISDEISNRSAGGVPSTPVGDGRSQPPALLLTISDLSDQTESRTT